MVFSLYVLNKYITAIISVFFSVLVDIINCNKVLVAKMLVFK